jgi:hypothetical protein
VRGETTLLTEHISKQMNELNLERCRWGLGREQGRSTAAFARPKKRCKANRQLALGCRWPRQAQRAPVLCIPVCRHKLASFNAHPPPPWPPAASRCIPKNVPGADWRVLEEIVKADPSREKYKVRYARYSSNVP